MIFYDKNGNRLEYKLGELISEEGQYGKVYKLDGTDCECIKLYNKGQVVDDKILMFIKNMDLKNFYKLYEMLYGRTGKFKAHTMRYYESMDIDILTMPVEYTLCSLCNLYESVIRLAEEHIYASDMHIGNVILGSNEITVIDVDIYSFSELQSIEKLKKRNISALRYLFRELYLNSLKEYHPEIDKYSVRQEIIGLFGGDRPFNLNNTCNKLIRYKKPFDCLKKDNLCRLRRGYDDLL